MFYTSGSCIGKRVFSMDIGDTAGTDITNLDICAAAGGADRAYDKTITGVTVSDGFLNIQSIYGSADDPEVTAIDVVPSGTAPPPPPDPSVVGQWSSPMSWPLVTVHASLLPTGNVIVNDGFDAEPNSNRIWNPTTQAFTPVPYGVNIFCSGHINLPDGRVFYAGGHLAADVGIPDATIYDPANQTWTAAATMSVGRWYPTATLLTNGDVLVTSGTIDLTVGNNALPQVYQLATNSWRFLTAAMLTLDLYPMMFLAPNGQVFMGGPGVTSRYLDTSGAGAWTFVANRNDRHRDYGSAVMYGDGKVLIMGGGDPPLNTAEVIDLNQPSPTWRFVGSMQFARRQLNSVMLPDGKVLVTGGTAGPGFNDPGGAVFAAELWDPATERWTTLASATIPRLYHSTTVLLPDGRVLSMGGNGFNDVEIFSPPYLFKGARPTITSAPTSVGYGQSFLVATPDTGIAKVTMIRETSVTHAFNVGQRYKELPFAAASGGVQVTAPPNPNQAPPGYYMLFIVNSNGVPSLAKIIQLGGGAPQPVPPASPATLSLVYNGKVRDRVGQGNLALGPDGVVDGTVTATLSAAGGRTITRLDLRSSTGGIWETDGTSVNWALGMAATLDGPLLNNPSTSAVNAQVADGGSFAVFASDFQNSLFPAGTTLTLTATFADGSGTSATTTVGATAPAPPTGTPALSVVYNGKARDRVGQDNLALGPDGVLDGTLTATLTGGARTITRLDLRSSTNGAWDTDGSTAAWAIGMATTLDSALLNNPSTTAVNAQVAATTTVGATAPAPPTGPPALSVVYNGKARDRVGQDNLALGPDGVADGTLTATLTGGSRTITRLDLQSSTNGAWDTDGSTAAWAIGMATTLDSALLNNPSTTAVNAQVADGGSFVVFASDFQNSLFPAGTTLTLTATFSDGSRASATTTISATAPPPAGPPALSVVYNGKVRDRVGQDNLALGPDGVLDGTMTATLTGGSRTITRLDLRSSTNGAWDTDGSTAAWAIGMATTLDSSLLNNPSTMAVNAAVADGGSFVVFAADFQNSLFLSGTTLTLTATFADGSTASGTATVSATAPTPPPPAPAPTLSSLSPNSATAGGAAFTLTVNGTNFVSGAVVKWNGAPRTTTFGSTTQLTAAIPASDIASQGTANVTVANPDSQTSGAQTFTIAAAPAPAPAPSPPPSSFMLTVSKSGPGTVTSSNVSGIDCGADCSELYAANTPVTLVATPNNRNRPVTWGGDAAACQNATSCTVPMDRAKTVTVRFN
jgi:hypothetical protein